MLEEGAARRALPTLDEDALERISLAARDCYDAAAADDVIGELEANRRFHFAILASPDQPHTMRHIRLLWESTEAYRAMYYNSPEERRRSIDATIRSWLRCKTVMPIAWLTSWTPTAKARSSGSAE